MEIGISFWIGFVVFVVIMLSLDLFVFHKKDAEVKIKEALLWSLFWIVLAFLFNVGVWALLGKQKAVEFLTGYLIEESLSIDNLFVFILIFSFFKIEAKYQHKVLFRGIIGAIIMRAVFIFAGVALIEKFNWIMYVFGGFLVYTGIKMLFDKQEESDFNPDKNFLVRMFRKFLHDTHDMSIPRFFVKKNGLYYATPFFVALLFIEISDLIFAVDSIPAVLSVSKDVFIVYTSNIFAILGLRSLFFALNGVMSYFYYLKYALAGILSFIGIKMCFNELAAEIADQFPILMGSSGHPYHISNFVSLSIIVLFITVSILFSIAHNKKEEQQ